MSTVETVPANQTANHIERLLRELAASRSVRFRVDAGDGLFIVWLQGETAPQCGCHADTWWTAGTDGWHLMAQFAAVRQIRFVREPDGHAPGRESLMIRFVGSSGNSSLRADFMPLYDDFGQPIAAQFARWEELRARYGGRDEVPVSEGIIVIGGS